MRILSLLGCLLFSACLFAQLNPVLPEAPQNVSGANSSSVGQNFSVNGGISVSGFSYNTPGKENIQRRPPLGYALNANITLKRGQFSLPFSVNLNEQGSRFSAPFSRFGISPHYKWVTAHLGHRNLSYSPFTLNGATFFGGGLDLRPGILKISAMYGSFQKARGLDDPNSFKPQFQRKGYAAQLGLGNYRNYFTFTYFKGEDDPTSLQVSDSIASKIDAHENAVFGLDGRIDLIKNKLSFELHSGLSIFSQDIRAYGLGEANQELVEPYAFIIKPNISTSANYAGTAALNYRSSNFSIGANYRRVMPDYQSLGVNYLLDDLEQITLAPRLSLLKGKLNINASLGLQRNDLLKQHTTQSNRFIGSASLDYQNPGGFGIGLQYGNYSLQQRVVRDTILNDSFLLNQVNQQINITPRLLLRGESMTHNFALLLSYQQLEDGNPATNALSNHKMLMANLNYSLRFQPADLQLRTGISLFNLQSAVAANDRYGSHLQLLKKLGHLEVDFGATYNWIMRQESRGTNYRLGGGIAYRISKNASIQLNSNYYDNTFEDRSFSEWINRIRFQYRFRSKSAARRDK